MTSELHVAISAHRDPRAGGRELALAILCHLEGRPEGERQAAAQWILHHAPAGDDAGENGFAELVADPDVKKMGRSLIELAEQRREAIDDHIRAASRRWRLERMDQVDRNVLRLATAELLGSPKTPRGVVVSEAVRLAQRYGSERSVAFVNGVIETIAKQIEAAGPSEADV